MWTGNNGWIAILVKYGFITLLQGYLTVPKWNTYVLIKIEYWTLWYMDHLSASSYTWVTDYQIWSDISWLINWYFRCSIVSPNVRKEYLNMVTFRISVLLLIKSWTFWYIERLPMSLYEKVIHFYKKMVQFFWPTLYIWFTSHTYKWTPFLVLHILTQLISGWSKLSVCVNQGGTNHNHCM